MPALGGLLGCGVTVKQSIFGFSEAHHARWILRCHNHGATKGPYSSWGVACFLACLL